MTLPLSTNNANLARVADAIDSRLVTMTQQVRDMRERMVLKAVVPSTTLREFILALIETQRFVGAQADLPGLSGEFARRYSGIARDFSFAAEWKATSQALAYLTEWCRSLYTAVDGQPVFERFNLKTGELEPYNVKFDTAGSADFVAALDAYLKTVD